MICRGGDNKRGAVRSEYVIAGGVSAVLIIGLVAVLAGRSSRVAYRGAAKTQAPPVQAPATPAHAERPRTEARPQPQPARPTGPVKPATPSADASETVIVTEESAPTKAPPSTPSPATPKPAEKPEEIQVNVEPVPGTAAPAGAPSETINLEEAPAAKPAAKVAAATPQKPVPTHVEGVQVIEEDGGKPAAGDLAEMKAGERPTGGGWTSSATGVRTMTMPPSGEIALQLADISRNSDVWVKRAFPSENQRMAWTGRLRFASVADGFGVSLMHGDKPAILVYTVAGQLGYEKDDGKWQGLMKIEANVWYNLRIDADVAAQTYGVYVNDRQWGPQHIKFRSQVPQLNAWMAGTPVGGTGTMYLSSVTVNKE